MQPTSIQNRIELLDILRGFAILGMFAVNMTVDLPFGANYWAQSFEGADRLTLILVNLTANGRFITIFSVLFGVGFWLQLGRAQAREKPFAIFYLRRLAGLFLIAATAIVLGLNAHILIDYATYGLLLLLFKTKAPRFLLVSIVVTFFAAQVPNVIDSYQLLRSEPQVERAVRGDSEAESRVAEDAVEKEREAVFLDGSFAEIMAYRARNLGRYLTSVGHYVADLDILGLLLIGLWVGQTGLIYDKGKRKRFAREAFPWLISIGSMAVVGFVYVEFFSSDAWHELPLRAIKWFVGWAIGMVPVGLAYAAGITMIADQPGWRRALQPLAAVGRLALTNYLLTTLIMAFVTYGWGLGLLNQLRPSSGLVIVLLVYPLQVIVSNWWVRRYRFGPFEWAWRSISYGQRPSFRIDPAPAADSALRDHD